MALTFQTNFVFACRNICGACTGTHTRLTTQKRSFTLTWPKSHSDTFSFPPSMLSFHHIPFIWQRWTEARYFNRWNSPFILLSRLFKSLITHNQLHKGEWSYRELQSVKWITFPFDSLNIPPIRISRAQASWTNYNILLGLECKSKSLSIFLSYLKSHSGSSFFHINSLFGNFSTSVCHLAKVSKAIRLISIKYSQQPHTVISFELAFNQSASSTVLQHWLTF